MKQDTNAGNFNGQEGAALVIAVLAVLLVTVIGFSLIATGMVATEISRNSREQTAAYYIAESGLSHATEVLQGLGSERFTALLQAGDGAGDSGDELSEVAAPYTAVPLEGLETGKGRYRIFIADDESDGDADGNSDSNGRLVVKAVGFGEDGATATVEAIVSSTGMPALLVDGNLRLKGNPFILGTNGWAHANGRIEILGTPCADLYFSSTGEISAGSAKGRGCSGSGKTLIDQDRVEPPVYNVRSDFYSKADFILGANGAQAGKVFSAVGTVIHDGSTDRWQVGDSVWKWHPGDKTWSHSGNEMPSGTYYSEGNMDVGGNYGDPGGATAVTLIAEGYIEISGNPYMRPKLSGISVAAGTDLQISGNPDSGEFNYQGVLYANHQVGFSGGPAIFGMVISANRGDTESPGCGCNPIKRDSDGFVRIGGNATITYNGSLLGGPVRIVSWREVRY